MPVPTKQMMVGAAALAAVAGMCVAHPGHPPIPSPIASIAAKPQPIPFELFRGNRIFLTATINGRPTEVMLDTGASLTTINRSYARATGLPQGFKIEAKGIGGSVDAEMVTGVELRVGGLAITQASVGVMDLTPIERSIGRPINAILGRDIFNAGVVSIDWAAKRLTIHSPDAFKPNAKATEVALARNGPFNTIPVSVAGGTPIRALLDLGNSGTLVLRRPYWEGRPEFASLRTARFEEGGVGGLRGARLTTVPQVTIGGQSFASVPAVLSDSSAENDPTQMANVGIGLLKQFRVDLDLGRDRIYLTPRADRPGFDRDRAGVRFNLEGDRLKATFVSSDGPAAAAGLKVGDEIVAVDGRAVTPAYYRSVDWTRGPAGRKVVLSRADGSKLTVTLADYY